MEHSRITPGVERILERAKELARQAGLSEMLPRHLFEALSQEESRGWEILQQLGVTAEYIVPQPPTALPLPESAEVQAGEDVQQVLSAAGIQAARQGRYAELGSEHLVAGLVTVDSDISRLLLSQGITAEQVQSLVDIGDEFPDQPLAVDFELSELRKPATEETDLYRILDAAANRVREGVRVLEDFVRFGCDDALFTSSLKTWRHDFRSVLAHMDDGRMLSARDSAADVGTSINTPGERHRQSLDDVIRASCKRVQEGLRTLEEYGKILSPVVGEAVSQLRYRFYNLEKRLVVNTDSQRRLAHRCVYILATREQCHLDFETTLRIALNAGADIVQLREKHLADRELVELGQHVRQWTRETDALFIMNDRPDLAMLVDADGVHVGQEELTVRQVRRIIGPDKLIGVSTHSIEQARAAVEEGANYLGVGPVFSSQTKSFSQLAGLEFVRQVAEEIRLPWFAIGGITPENLPELQTAGATRIAVSQAVCGSDSPGEMVTQFKEALIKNR